MSQRRRPHPDGNWLVELEPCHTVHFLSTHEYNAVPDQMTGIRLAHDVLEANTDVQLPNEADWEAVQRTRCDLCGRRRMCARWQRKITDFRKARMCRQCKILSWPPLEPRHRNPDAGRPKAKLDETYAEPHWTKQLAAFRASNLAPH